MTHPGVIGTAGVSGGAAFVSYVLQGLPVVQFLAALVAIVAGAISIYRALK